MAITITEQPPQFFPAFHPTIWIADSTIKANDQFRYLFRIQVGATIREIEVPPRPGDGFGFFDASQHLQDFIDQDIVDFKQSDPTIIQAAPKTLYNMQISEKFKDGTGATVIISGPVVNTRIAMNTVFNRLDILQFTEAKYKLTDSSTRFMWNIEEKVEVFKDDIFFIHVAADPSTLRVVFLETKEDGTTTTTNADVGFSDRTNLLRIDLALDLNDPNEAVEFCIHIEPNGGGVDVSETKCLTLIESCSRFTNKKFIYLDEQGSYNSLNFDHASRKVDTAKPKTFKKFIDASTESDLSRPITRYFNDPTEIHTANTDFLTDKHNIMLVDLINSNRVILDVRTDPEFPGLDFLPVEILTKTIQELKAENSELAQFEIRYRFSFDKVSR